jgi:hypothetical protein
LRRKNGLVVDEVSGLLKREDVSNLKGYLYILRDQNSNDFFLKFLSNQTKAVKKMLERSQNASGILLQVALDSRSNADYKLDFQTEVQAGEAYLTLSKWAI